MKDNGTDRDIALSMVNKLTDISTLISTINYNLYAPYITAQPINQTGAVGENVYFTVTAQRVTSYKWQVNNGVDDWADTTLVGNNTATLTVDVVARRDGYQFRCKLTGKDGTIVYSDPATLTVAVSP